MAGGLEGEVAGGDGGSTGHGRGLYSRTVQPAARIDAWTQSPCCSAESDGTSAKNTNPGVRAIIAKYMNMH